jgi:hypothetical protein
VSDGVQWRISFLHRVSIHVQTASAVAHSLPANLGNIPLNLTVYPKSQ